MAPYTKGFKKSHYKQRLLNHVKVACQIFILVVPYLQIQKRRIAALASIPWPESRKDEVEPALIPDLTSSDEEGFELTNDDPPEKKKMWKVKRIAWESAKLLACKQELDEHWLSHVASQREARGQLKRVRGLVESSRPRPNHARFPAWAVSGKPGSS